MYNQYQGINVTFYLKVFALSAEGHQAESEIEKAWIVSIVPIISSLLFALLKIISLFLLSALSAYSSFNQLLNR